MNITQATIITEALERPLLLQQFADIVRRGGGFQRSALHREFNDIAIRAGHKPVNLERLTYIENVLLQHRDLEIDGPLIVWRGA